MKRYIVYLSILLLLPVASLLAKPVVAAENFITDYNVVYSALENGTTHALITVTLTNATSDYYVSSYKMQLGFENIVNVEAHDSGGKINPVTTKTDDGQLVEVTFNKKVVGLGNKQVLKLSFDTPDITKRQGRVWEINIPGIANQDGFNTFDVELEVPKSFGKPAYIKPAQPDNSLNFTKEQLGKSGISVSFGDKQVYDFALTYHLQNKNLFPIRTEIALPPGTNYQDVYFDSIEPAPLQVKKDQDGNWLAEYDLLPSKRIDVVVKGKAELFLTPKKELVSEKELNQYLQEKPYWQLSNTEIQKLADELVTPEKIYEYVVKTLSYDFSRITSGKARVGAAGVLTKPSSAVCLEFTDLFVAIARAAGIPAREVNGFAYTENPKQRPLSLVQDVLHAWPEYYDKEQKTWVMVDPTWGNTTGGVDYFHVLDFDHFTFVKKGLSSTYPIPAGGYKVAGDEFMKDVIVNFASEIDTKTAQLVIEPVISDSLIGGLPVSGKVRVINKGPGKSNDQQLILRSNTLTPRQQVKQIDGMLPFEVREISFQFDKQPFLTKSTHTITMILAGEQATKSIQIIPIYVKEWRLIGGAIFGLFSIIILIITIKTRRVRLS